MDTKIIPLRPLSYTRCSKDDECERAGYLGREWGGTGLQPINAGWALVFGNIQHVHLERLAKSGSIDYAQVRADITKAATDADYDGIYARDWSALAEGQLRGFVKSVWPNLMAEYEIEDTENWILWEPEPGYMFKARQDLLLRNKHNGNLVYIDYKTTSSTKPQWIASWNKSAQLHTSMYAIQKSQGKTIHAAIVIGLNKGYRDDKNHIQRSPMTYGYVNREYAMTPDYSYEYKRAKGWEMFSPMQEWGDMEKWVANMPLEILSAQYPQTAPIFLRDDIAEKWFKQKMIRAKEIGDAVQRLQTSTNVDEINAILDVHFRQNFSKCQPAYGFDCEFLPICWQGWIGADPLGSGLFKRYENSEAELE